MTIPRLVTTLLLLWTLAPSRADAELLLQITGDGAKPQTIDAGDAIALSFTTTQAYANVTILAGPGVGCVGCTATAWLTTDIGATYSAADLKAVNVLNPWTPFLLTGQTLGVGTYYVIVSVDTGSLVWPGSVPVTGTAVPAFSAGETRRAAAVDLADAPSSVYDVLLPSAGDVHFVVTSEVMGDGKRDLGEDCDDGDTASGDGCSSTGTVEPGYTCTDLFNQLSVCTPTTATCGDGVVNGVDACDDGNAAVGDGCRPDCTIEACGDGIVDPQDDCDVGPDVAGDCCADDCTFEAPATPCSDGEPCTADACNDEGVCVSTPLTDTECDDGDACTTPDRCVDGVCGGDPVPCDDHNPCTSDACNGDGNAPLCVHDNNHVCIGVRCGNGVVDAADGETCDPPNAATNPTTGLETCRLDCTSCGDGTRQANDQESCDDGNTISGCDPTRPQTALDACQNDCTPPICSDPARIQSGAGLARFDFHGRLVIDRRDATISAADEMFSIQLTAPDGRVVFRASILPGAIEERTPSYFRYKVAGARAHGGIQRLTLHRVRGAYRAVLRAYGDLSGAQSLMRTEVFVGSTTWTLAGEWQAIQKGWKLVPPSRRR